MYKISKEFTFAMAHRLSCHKDLCKNLHGHNYRVEVGIKSKFLNDEGMVMDFAQLKSIVMEFLDTMDHALMVNGTDLEMILKMKEDLPELKVLIVPYEPTAENMAKEIYMYVAKKIECLFRIKVDYVTIYETDTSKATYMK